MVRKRCCTFQEQMLGAESRTARVQDRFRCEMAKAEADEMVAIVTDERAGEAYSKANVIRRWRNYGAGNSHEERCQRKVHGKLREAAVSERGSI